MPANSWPDKDLEEFKSLLSDLSVEENSFNETLSGVSHPSRFKNRRRKAAIVLTFVWSSTIALHLVSWAYLFVAGLTTILGLHALVVFRGRPRNYKSTVQGEIPFVSVLVAAKNEEAVIGDLVKTLCNLQYPAQRYEVWVIDDNSSDRTPQLLAHLAQKYEKLNIFRRKPEATGGKSGALNQVLPLTQGEIVAVFDADAQVPSDVLLQVVPFFEREKLGAVQLRKAIANSRDNFWTKGQTAEMAFDAYLNRARAAIGGIGELRGNGQFVRREALVRCGGWNEETITDDLDLTIRLHLDKWDIECAFYPAVEEEGVTTAIALWHQRNRWAEGGYQRYLDYWDLILRNRMGMRKTWDLLAFAFIQYIIPTAVIPDLLMAIARHRLPVLTPFSSLGFTVSFVGMFAGFMQVHREKRLGFSSYSILLLQTLRGTLYFLHWFVVMSSTTARVSLRPKRLKWVKTVHQGTSGS